jgi:hypothetical protein
MTDQGERFVIVVSDHAPAASAAPAGANGQRSGHGRPVEVAHEEDGGIIPAGFGLAVISGLADDVRVSSTSSGVSVRMSWPSAVTV